MTIVGWQLTFIQGKAIGYAGATENFDFFQDNILRDFAIRQTNIGCGFSQSWYRSDSGSFGGRF